MKRILPSLTPADLAKLTPREQYIVQRYYGLDGNAPQAFKEIAKPFGVSAQLVGLIHKKALQRLSLI